MSKTLQQIRTDFRLLIAQQDSATSDFTDAEINGFANESLEHVATRAEYPRDIAEIQGQDGVAVYTLPSDSLSIRVAYYGDAGISGDIRKLRILEEKALAEYRPSWLDTTSANKGRPDTLMLLNRKQVMLSPAPDATNASTGRKLYLSYIYTPAAMTSDSDVPDLPQSFHPLLKFRMAVLAYLGKLANPKIAVEMSNLFDSELQKILNAATKEVEQRSFFWGNVGQDFGNDFYYERNVNVTP